MERFSIAIERLGYLQEESVDLFSLVDADVFASWLDHFEVPHALRTDGTIEVRIYSICVPSPLERYIAHEDEDYSSEDYDLWTVDPAIFEAAAFIRQIAGTEVVTELIDEAYGIWTAGTALGAFSPTMDRDELEEAFGQLYRGHYASVAALLVQTRSCTPDAASTTSSRTGPLRWTTSPHCSESSGRMASGSTTSPPDRWATRRRRMTDAEDKAAPRHTAQGALRRASGSLQRRPHHKAWRMQESL